ncbi:hypothetical protein BYT27DRAFT_7130055 [Phlegmacium glaucopus]|nr:hypothetical protein BYT27DRAFT_7130055 [Phlegmacium glaucopus]
MNTINGSDDSDATTGERKKRKMADKWELSTANGKPPKRTKKAVSREDTSEDRLTPPTASEQESSSTTLNTHPDLLNETHFSTSHFSGAHHFVSNGGTYNNIFGNYVVMAEQNDENSESRMLKGIVKGSPVFTVEDMSLERQIYKGREYRLHAAKTSGKVVAMKVYEGRRARERCSEAARFNQKVIHPNILPMIGVSPLESELPFLVFDGGYEGPADYLLGQVLKKDINQSLTLGLQTVIGLSSGLGYLQDLKYPFESVGLDHFVIFSGKGKIVISFDPGDLVQVNLSDQELGLSNNTDRALTLFHQLCQRTFDGACKAHYESQQIQRTYVDEFDVNIDDLPENRFEELDDAGKFDNGSGISNSSTALGRQPSGRSPRRPSGRRRQLVWKSPGAEAVALSDISYQFQDFLNTHLSSSTSALNHRPGRYTARTPHRCPGYNRIEITLTANITHSAIVSHSSPTPHEICPVCKEVVKDAEILNCLCGSNDDESKPTVQCSTCFEWHHRLCVGFSDVEHRKFVCERCNPSYPSYSSRSLQPMRRLPPLTTSSPLERWQQSSPVQLATGFPGNSIRSPTASYPPAYMAYYTYLQGEASRENLRETLRKVSPHIKVEDGAGSLVAGDIEAEAKELATANYFSQSNTAQQHFIHGNNDQNKLSRTQLNDACQHILRNNRFSAKMPKYEYHSRGPQHNTIWTAIISIEGIEYGMGEGRTQDAASDAAATQALSQLLNQYGLQG